MGRRPRSRSQHYRPRVELLDADGPRVPPRLAQRDAEYRQCLGIGAGETLPPVLGNASGHHVGVSVPPPSF